MVLLDVDGIVISWNRGAELVEGYSFDEIGGQHFSIFYPPEAIVVGHPEGELAQARASGHYNERGWRVRRDGTRFWASVTIVAMFAEDGSLEGYGKFTRDLTAQMQSEQQAANTFALLRATAQTDALTGASTRRAFDVAMANCLAQGRPFCVAMFDLDNFKHVNDTLGHAAGDRVLRQVSSAWREGLRPGDLLGRYGGEEFALILNNCELHQGVATAERLHASTPAACTCSAGVTAWSPGMTSDALLAAADAALYKAKLAGRNRVVSALASPAGAGVESELRVLAHSGDQPPSVAASAADLQDCDRGCLEAPVLALVTDSAAPSPSVDSGWLS